MIRFGIDELLAGSDLKRQRIGLVTNDAARLAADASVKSRIALCGAGFKIVRLFGPEHGIGAAAADGAAVEDSIDLLTQIPVTSLYGRYMRPPAESLADLDAVVFDIADIGARFYTYIWTLSHVLEACADAGKPVWVLDRPNPLGGGLADVEGPMLDEAACASFIGRWSIPIRHSLTAGELATVWNAQRRLGCDLRIISCTGWSRSMHWPDTGLPFVPTSPAIANYNAALVYAGTCLFEGTNLSEGRGTDRPFRLIGAPWLDGAGLAEKFNSLDLPGIRLTPRQFVPGTNKHAGRRCEGVEWQVTDPRALSPVAASLHALALVVAQHPSYFSFEPYPTAANPAGGAHFDRLVGTRSIRESVACDPVAAANYVKPWTAAPDWRVLVEPHLLYV